MNRLTLRRGAVLAAMMGGLACHHYNPQTFRQPTVAFRDVRVRGVGLKGGAVDVVVRVYNPNPYRLDIRRTAYTLMSDTVTVGRGTLDKPFRVGSGDSTVLHLPITFSYAALGSAGQVLMNTGTAPYRVLGALTLATETGPIDVPYDQTGQFSTLNVGTH